MATVAVTLICAAVEGFLFYVLIHLGRELSKERGARAAVAAIPISRASETMAEGREFRKVINITDAGRLPYRDGRRRMAS